MTYVVGLTGGIGSGKTAVSDRFAQLGITIVDADVAARVVVEPGTPALQQIGAHFGDSVIQADGTLDRAVLRQKIFADEAEKRWLEQLLHPLIGQEILNSLAAAQSDYVLFVSPLLVEAKQTVLADRVLVVDVPEEVQLERTMSRDGNDADQVKTIMASQASRQERLNHADDVIENWHGFDHLDAEVARLHQLYLQLAEEKQQAAKQGQQ